MSDTSASAPVGASWRSDNPERFSATVTAAAERLDLPERAVEKDYWVCRALRAVVMGFNGQVIFKGGTSLEKLRLIQRFSEDLDLLVTADLQSPRAAKRRMQDMIAAAAAACEGTLVFHNSGKEPGASHRAMYLTFPAASGGAGGLADPERVLLELGQVGGRHPSIVAPVESLLARTLADADFDTAEWADLAPFDAPILHPGRTLLEKLLRMNNFAAGDQHGVHGWDRIGRQYYDVWALLGDQRVVDLLAAREQAEAVLDDAMAVSAAIKRPDAPMPAGGFAASSVFDPAGSLAAQLRQEHDKAMAIFYYGAAPGPSFDDVLERVADNAELLNPRR